MRLPVPAPPPGRRGRKPLRPTWHVVAAADLRWILALSAPRVHAANKYWYKKLGLDDAVLARG